MVSKRRALTEQELLYLERFRAIWNEKKQALNLTQEMVGHACGWNGQSAFSQYMGGIVPLNIEAVLRLAKVLQVHPADIMPDISELLPEGRGDATAVTKEEKDALELANMILELTTERRVALQSVVQAFSNRTEKPVKSKKQKP